MSKYPIRVLRKKLNSTNNIPLLVDNFSNTIKVSKSKGSTRILWFPLALSLVSSALLLLDYQVVKPIVETAVNNYEYSKLDKEYVNVSLNGKLKLDKVEYSTDVTGRRIATIPRSSNDLQESLDYLATVPDIEEVEADKDVITVTFFVAN